MVANPSSLGKRRMHTSVLGFMHRVAKLLRGCVIRLISTGQAISRHTAVLCI